MATTTRKQKSWFSTPAGRHIMAAACLAAGLGLTACDDTANQAQRDAAEAARRTAAAGQPRATDKLYQEVEATSPEDMNKLRTDIEAKVKAGGDAWKQYLQQETVEKDLAQANDLIQSALKIDNPALKSVVGAEAGDTARQLADAKFNDIQKKMGELVTQALILQQISDTAIMQGAQADALQPSAQAAAAADVAQLRSRADAAKAAVAQAQSEVDRIQKDIAAKQDQARDIYAQTDASFKAADALAGQAAIDAANKSMETRKQADTLTAQAAAEDAALNKAKSDLDIATVEQKQGDSAVADAAAAADSAVQSTKQAADRLASLREQAKKIVQEALADRYKTFVTLANSLDADIKSAAQSAREAAGDYSTALTQLQQWQRELSEQAQKADLKAGDAIKAAATDVRTLAILNWSQAAASGEAGRINSAGYTAAGLANAIATQAAEAYKRAGLGDAPAKPTLDGDAYKKAAVEAFTAAASAAKTGTDRGSPDMEKIKWIGYGLQAIAQQGLSLVADKAMADTARAAAKTAGLAAIDGNPDMRPQMQGLAVGI